MPELTITSQGQGQNSNPPPCDSLARQPSGWHCHLHSYHLIRPESHQACTAPSPRNTGDISGGEGDFLLTGDSPNSALSWQGCADGPHLHLSLDPGPHDVGLAGKLAAEVLVGLLLALLLQEGVVPLGHQLLHLDRGRARPSGGPLPGGPCPSPANQHAHLLPLGVDDLGGDGGVRVAA